MLKNIFTKFIKVGQSDQYDKVENKKIEYLNITLIVLSLLLVSSLSTNIINQKWSILFDSIIYMGCSFCIALVALFHFYDRPKAARIAFFFLPILVIAIACLIIKVTFLLELLNIIFLVIFFNYFAGRKVQYFYGAYQLLIYNFVFYLIHFSGRYTNAILSYPINNFINYNLIYIGLFFIIRITIERIAYENKQKEQAMKELQNQVVKTQAAYESMESFAYVISHDIKAPLNSMNAFAALLEQGIGKKSTEELKLYSHYINSEGNKLATMIDEVLYFAQLSSANETEKMVENHIPKMVDEITTYLLPLYPTAQISCSANIPLIYGGASKIKMLLQNLIENGLKYNRSKPARVNIKSEATDRLVKLIIEDNGIGIAKKNQDRIFELFKRLHTNKEYEGTGVGLANCKKIVEHHLKGKLTVESEVGKGSKFVIALPLLHTNKGKSNV